MLAEKGIDINNTNLDGDTCLHLCAQNGAKENIRIIQKLLELKADPNIKNLKGESFYSLLGNEGEERISSSGVSVGNTYLNSDKDKKNHNNLSKLKYIFFYFLLPLLILVWQNLNK
jgi:ankyrin repeat protein